MAKIQLGLAYKLTRAGAGEPRVVNGGDWASKVVDVRDIMNNVDLEYHGLVRFFSFAENGCLVTTVRKIESRDGDNLAIWLFIPSDADIDGTSREMNEDIIAKVLNRIDKLIMKNQISDDELRDVVDIDIKQRSVAVAYTPSPKNGGYAFRRVDELHPVSLLLGNDCYQEYYDSFRCIFLRYSSEMRLLKGITDLTDQKFGRRCVLLPPSRQDVIEVFGEGVTINQITARGEKKEFITPLAGAINKTFEFEAQRRGCEPVRFSIRLTEADQRCNLPMFRGWNFIVKRSWFDIVDEKNRQLNTARITVNGQTMHGDKMLVPLTESYKARVNISCNGYTDNNGRETITSTIDLTQKPKTFVLRQARREIEYSVTLADGSTGTLTTESNFHKGQTPLEGYWIDNYGRVHYDSEAVKSAKKKSFLFGFLTMLGIVLAVALVWVAVSVVSSFFDTPQPDQPTPPEEENVDEYTQYDQQVPPPNQTYAFTDDQTIRKIEWYLDESKPNIWSRDELERIPGLAGLYDMLNDYDLESIESVYGNINSRNLGVLKEALRANREAGGNPRQAEHNPRYSNDGKIAINGYKDWLNKTEGRVPGRQVEPSNSNGSTTKVGTATDSKTQKTEADKKPKPNPKERKEDFSPGN